MFDALPKWMNDLAPWLTWIGLAGVVVSIIFDMLRRIKRFRDHTKSAIDD